MKAKQESEAGAGAEAETAGGSREQQAEAPVKSREKPVDADGPVTEEQKIQLQEKKEELESVLTEVKQLNRGLDRRIEELATRKARYKRAEQILLELLHKNAEAKEAIEQEETNVLALMQLLSMEE